VLTLHQQILERTQSHTRLPPSSQGGVPSKSTYADSGLSEDQYSAAMGSDPGSLRRVDSGASSRLSKDKK